MAKAFLYQAHHYLTKLKYDWELSQYAVSPTSGKNPFALKKVGYALFN